MKRLILLSIVLFTGCATQHTPAPMPKPAPMKFCGENETENCQPLTPGQRGGSSRGHTEEPKTEKMMFYVPPEELWPEEFPPAPKVCASPFQGRLITR